MPVNGQDVKFNYYTRAKFNTLSSKDANTMYYVEETDGKIKQYIGNTLVVSDITKAEIEAKLTGNITTHTHSTVTTSVAGFMSATDKTKLNSIASGAQNRTISTNAQALAGTNNTTVMTPLRVKEAISASGGGGGGGGLTKIGDTPVLTDGSSLNISDYLPAGGHSKVMWVALSASGSTGGTGVCAYIQHQDDYENPPDCPAVIVREGKLMGIFTVTHINDTVLIETYERNILGYASTSSKDTFQLYYEDQDTGSGAIYFEMWRVW